jgi:hypothetical protein
MIPWWVTSEQIKRAEQPMRFDVYNHFVAPDLVDLYARIDRMQRDITGLLAQGTLNMATTTELVALATALSSEIKKFGPAVDALEAAVTAALDKIPGGIPAEAQAEIDAAVVSLKESLTFAQSAVADAADGVDESQIVQP